MSIDKVIITNASALTSKYGKEGYGKIIAALGKLIAADAKRGLTSRLIALDSKLDMAPYGKPVNSADNERAAKAAVDAIHAKENPDYILILGAGDVVPLVQLKNPIYSANGDIDKTVPSDLPYACDARFSIDINHFVGPTRVVGRLPDLVGANNPRYLLKLIAAAARYKSLAPEDFKQFFGLSAKVWQGSTHLSLTKLFGNAAGMNTAPPSGPKWSATQLAPRAHFINCHGAHLSYAYYGQPPGKQEFPIAHSAEMLPKKIVPGTVLAAECCYGAELYDPAKSSGQAGIAYTYLGEGAYGVFGSTTIAYGPSQGNGSADLICQYFMHAVMEGASLGRATLEARHRFAGEYSHLSPVNLKTLAQFYLLGDPSIHPVAMLSHALNQTKAFKSAFRHIGDSGVRSLRRERLQRIGTSLHKELPRTLSAVPGNNSAPSAEIRKVLTNAAKESGLSEHTSLHFHVAHQRPQQKGAGSKRTVHVLAGAKEINVKAKKAGIKQIVTIIATAENGRLIHLGRLHSR